MKKKSYKKATIEIIAFDNEQAIMASGNLNDQSIGGGTINDDPDFD
ncbi:MAG: hypothetical protein IJV39_06150 [Ruminococcus sp.]|nr:hypothetical protein [Ruminococcus sp.]